MYIEINAAIEWTVLFVSVCILIDTLEKLYNFREFQKGGIFYWEWLRKFPGFNRRRIIRWFADFVFELRVWFSLVSLRGIAAAGLLIWPSGGNFRLPALCILFVIGSLENFRRMPSLPEAPNRFTLTIIGALVLQGFVPTETVTSACLWFIALQSCLSYATAGFAKLLKHDWRKGIAIFKAFNSTYYLTTPAFAKMVDRNPLIGTAASYTTISMECLFPLVLLVGKPYFLIFLIWGTLLHIANAVMLRLNNYFWPWIATYPAIIYVAQGT